MMIGCLLQSDVSVICRKFGEVSCTECTGHENDFELILTVKMETRNHTEGYFGSEFPAICNHCGVMATWSRKTLKMFWEIFASFGKTTACDKIFKILFRKFSSRHRSTCSNFVTFGRREVGKIVSFGLPAVAAVRIAPKICQASPRQYI